MKHTLKPVLKPLLATVAAAGTTLLLATPALADRPPTATEQASIEQVLKAGGFVSWEKIELDDDGPYWEIDNARTANAADGKFDLKLDPQTLKIIAREKDD